MPRGTAEAKAREAIKSKAKRELWTSLQTTWKALPQSFSNKHKVCRDQGARQLQAAAQLLRQLAPEHVTAAFCDLPACSRCAPTRLLLALRS